MGGNWRKMVQERLDGQVFTASQVAAVASADACAAGQSTASTSSIASGAGRSTRASGSVIFKVKRFNMGGHWHRRCSRSSTVHQDGLTLPCASGTRLYLPFALCATPKWIARIALLLCLVITLATNLFLSSFDHYLSSPHFVHSYILLFLILPSSHSTVLLPLLVFLSLLYSFILLLSLCYFSFYFFACHSLSFRAVRFIFVPYSLLFLVLILLVFRCLPSASSSFVAYWYSLLAYISDRHIIS